MQHVVIFSRCSRNDKSLHTGLTVFDSAFSFCNIPQLCKNSQKQKKIQNKYCSRLTGKRYQTISLTSEQIEDFKKYHLLIFCLNPTEEGCLSQVTLTNTKITKTHQLYKY